MKEKITLKIMDYLRDHHLIKNSLVLEAMAKGLYEFLNKNGYEIIKRKENE